MNESLRDKGSDRIQVNSILLATCIGILTIQLSVSGQQINSWIIGQLLMAIPFFAVSSLSYAKLKYRDDKEIKIWDWFGWFCHTIGYSAIINSIYLTLRIKDLSRLANLFLAVFFLLLIIYSIVNIILDKKRIMEKGLKLLIYVVLIFGGINLPNLFFK